MGHAVERPRLGLSLERLTNRGPGLCPGPRHANVESEVIVPDVIEQFCSAYHSFNGISQDRQVRQRRVLRAFECFAGAKIETLDATSFRDYLNHLVVDEGLHPNTVRQYGNMIRPFFGWAFDAGIVSGDVLLRIQRVKNPRGATAQSIPRPYSRKEMARFWVELERTYPMDGGRLWPRYVRGTSRWRRLWRWAMRLQVEAIVALALDCGLRRSEIERLALDDFHYDNEFVVVRYPAKKADKNDYREVPVTPHARQAFRAWIELRTLLKPGHDYPWLCISPWSRDVLAALPSDRLAELMGTVGEWELHRFRHTFATARLRQQMPIQELKEVLGHASIQQTLAYAKVATADIGRSMHRNTDAFDREVRPNQEERAA